MACKHRKHWKILDLPSVMVRVIVSPLLLEIWEGKITWGAFRLLKIILIKYPFHKESRQNNKYSLRSSTMQTKCRGCTLKRAWWSVEDKTGHKSILSGWSWEFPSFLCVSRSWTFTLIHFVKILLLRVLLQNRFSLKVIFTKSKKGSNQHYLVDSELQVAENNHPIGLSHLAVESWVLILHSMC